MYLNDVQKFSTGGLPDNTPYSFTVAPGELKAGWNVINHRNDAGATCWMCWDFFKLEFVPNPDGTIMIMR